MGPEIRTKNFPYAVRREFLSSNQDSEHQNCGSTLESSMKIKSGEIINIPYVGGENNFSKEEIKTVIFYAYSSSFLMIIIVGLYIGSYFFAFIM